MCLGLNRHSIHICWINKQCRNAVSKSQSFKERNFVKILTCNITFSTALKFFCYASNITIFCFSRTKYTKCRVNRPWFRWTSEKNIFKRRKSRLSYHTTAHWPGKIGYAYLITTISKTIGFLWFPFQLVKHDKHFCSLLTLKVFLFM